MDRKELFSLIAGAFAVDAQLFSANLLMAFQRSPQGQRAAGWAQSHPTEFGIFVHTLSAGMSRLPRDGSDLENILCDVFRRLPADMCLLLLPREDDQEYIHFETRQQLPGLSEMDEALEDLTPDQLRFVASLSEADRRRYASSPKKLRPYVLEQMQNEAANDPMKSLAESAAKWAEKMRLQREKRRNWW